MSMIHILQHALGRNEYGQPKNTSNPDFRNHFCTGEGSSDFDFCRQAVVLGLMTEYPPSVISGDAHIFVVTELGKIYIKENSPKPPKLTQSQRRYRRFLDSDGMFGSFANFLTWESKNKGRTA